jgi:hypothetical protein
MESKKVMSSPDAASEPQPQLSAQRQALPEAVRIVCSGQAEGSCMHAIASATEAARSSGSGISFEVTVATCKLVLLDFGILDAPKTGEA